MSNTLAGFNDPLGLPQEPEGPMHMDTNVGDSMFSTMGRPPSFAPSSEAMAKAMEDAKRIRRVVIKEVVSRTYNLSDKKECKQYTDDLKIVMMGSAASTHQVLARPEKQFVSDASGARYIAYLEWVEYQLLEQAVPTVGDKDE